MTDPIKLSPSDLTFLWDECKRCFYLKYRHGITRPAAPFPGIFSKIDRLMKAYFAGRPSVEINPALPPGQVVYGEKWVESQPIQVPGHSLSCYIRGKFDTVIAFDDSSFGVVDFKTAEPRPEFIPFYGRQLHAYCLALEHAAVGKFSLTPVSRLGLLVVSPEAMMVTASGEIAYLGGVTWIEVPRNDVEFLGFLGDVVGLLEQPDIPPAAADCSYCEYRAHARSHGM